MPDDKVGMKAKAGLALVAVSTTVGILYKVSQAKAGGFKYSTTSAIAIAEFMKFCMSVSFHAFDPSYRQNSDDDNQQSPWAAAKAQLNARAVFHIWVLSFLYTLNNQVSFNIYTLADPGTVYLFKAGSTMITATLQCLLVGKIFSKEQWEAMFLQGVGMIIVQYNPCQGSGRYAPMAYALLVFSAVLTSVCNVRNEYLVKNYKIGLNVQNAVLYFGGTWMNLLAFNFLPNPNSAQAGLSFFDGFGDPLAVGVVFANAMIGLAITAVYKYADAITKCIAGDVTAVLLCIISTWLFELQSSITMWCGVIVVCFAVHLYVDAQPTGPSKAHKSELFLPSSSSANGPERGLDSEQGKPSESEMATLVGKRPSPRADG